MSNSFEKFKTGLRPTEILGEYPEYFIENSKLVDLVYRLGQHLDDLDKSKISDGGNEIIIGSMTILAGISTTIDSVMLLSNFGRGAEALALTRRLWELWFYLLFISTNPHRWFFLYNREDVIARIIKHKYLLDHPELTKRGNSLDTAEFTESPEHKLERLRAEFTKNGYKIPENLSKLSKKFRSSWAGINRKEMKEMVTRKYGDESLICELLNVGYAYGFSITSQLLHATGIFASTVRKRNAESIDFTIHRNPRHVRVALLESLAHGCHSMIILTKEMPIKVSEEISAAVMKQFVTINQLREHFVKTVKLDP